MNKTLCLILLCTIVHTVPSFGQVRLKRIFQDKDFNNRTNVIKETGENDYSILDEQFGDAKVGEVVRIAVEKPKTPKPPKPPKPEVVKTTPVKEIEKLPKVKVEAEVFKAKGNSDINVVAPKSAPAPRRRQFSASPSEYESHKTYQAQLPKIKFWQKKKRRVKKNKSRKSCYFFN